MKAVRSLLVPLSLLVMFLGLAVTGTKAQSLFSTHFAGTFNLPFMVQWGSEFLPPGEYSLYYGRVGNAGSYVVEIRGEGTLPQAMFRVNGRSDVKGTEDALVCVREDNKVYVRGLELATIGESAQFTKPHGVSVEAWIIAGNKSYNTNTQLAVARIPIAPVK